MTILDQLSDYARVRVREDMKQIPPDEMKALALALPKGQGTVFTEALKKPGMSFICEVKKASPSKGVISSDFPYLDIALSYEDAGADCISCLTEPRWFLGSDEIFREIRARVSLPMLRKDFTVDPYQIYQARVLGANAVLLIASLLDTKTISSYLSICDDLGLAALVEAHTKEEIASAKDAGAKIIGVNNRNLKDFSVDFENARRLRDLIPADALYVAESGVKDASDVATLHAIGADAALIGETLMRSSDKKKMLKAFREAAK